MAEPPEISRHGRSHRSRRIGALAGLLVGAGILAAIVWSVTSRGGHESAPLPPPAATTAGPPPKPVLRIVFPEGFTRKEMAKRIAAVNDIAKRQREIVPSLSPPAYLRLTKTAKDAKLPAGFKRSRPPTLEGFLFPATYDFTEDTTTRRLVGMQLDAFRENWAKVDLAYAKAKNLTPYDVLIIASMIEKEVRVPKERPLVAAVIYNRLKRRLPLGIDATIRYGLDIPPTKAIRQSQLDSGNPYNTRTHTGLPPTPIANPGLASLQAAAHPAKVGYLYFIRRADCRSHFFTASEQKFLAYSRAGLQC